MMALGGKGGGLREADEAKGGRPGAWKGWSEMGDWKPGPQMPLKSSQHPSCTPRLILSPQGPGGLRS